MRNRGVSNLIFVIIGGFMLAVIGLIALQVIGENIANPAPITAPQQNTPDNGATSQPAPSQQPNSITGANGAQ